MPHDTEDMIQLLLNTNKEQEQTIVDLRATIKELRSTIANLNETIDELKRKIFGTSSEKTRRPDQEEGIQEEETVTVVKEHTRTRRKKSVRADLYEALPIKEISCDVPPEERICPDCGSPMEHLGYKFVREELRITPAKVVRVHYMQETLMCPVCRQEDETMIVEAKTPTPLLAHSSRIAGYGGNGHVPEKLSAPSLLPSVKRLDGKRGACPKRNCSALVQLLFIGISLSSL